MGRRMGEEGDEEGGGEDIKDFVQFSPYFCFSEYRNVW